MRKVLLYFIRRKSKGRRGKVNCMRLCLVMRGAKILIKNLYPEQIFFSLNHTDLDILHITAQNRTTWIQFWITISKTQNKIKLRTKK